MLSRYRSGLTTAQWLCQDMAARSRTLLSGNQLSGMFADGIRHGSVKRCASAVRESAMAVTLVHRYLASP
jgi:hypothetical protein